MTQYIDKNRVEEILRNLWKQYGWNTAEHRICYNKALQEVQCKLDTLEVKEVDLEKELKLLDNTLFDLDGVAVQGATHYLTVEDVKDIARHFFELGMSVSSKVQKGE